MIKAGPDKNNYILETVRDSISVNENNQPDAALKLKISTGVFKITTKNKKIVFSEKFTFCRLSSFCPNIANFVIFASFQASQKSAQRLICGNDYQKM